MNELINSIKQLVLYFKQFFGMDISEDFYQKTKLLPNSELEKTHFYDSEHQIWKRKASLGSPSPLNSISNIDSKITRIKNSIGEIGEAKTMIENIESVNNKIGEIGKADTIIEQLDNLKVDIDSIKTSNSDIYTKQTTIDSNIDTLQTLQVDIDDNQNKGIVGIENYDAYGSGGTTYSTIDLTMYERLFNQLNIAIKDTSGGNYLSGEIYVYYEEYGHYVLIDGWGKRLSDYLTKTMVFPPTKNIKIDFYNYGDSSIELTWTASYSKTPMPSKHTYEFLVPAGTTESYLMSYKNDIELINRIYFDIIGVDYTISINYSVGGGGWASEVYKETYTNSIRQIWNIMEIDYFQLNIENNSNTYDITGKFFFFRSESEVEDSLPIGTILMYNGSGIANVGSRSSQIGDEDSDNIKMEGWYVCNGNSSTPNIIDKFVRGESVAGNMGGSDSHTLTT
ncbi:MAG: hypothetical protein GF329_15150, partial [Candidatus Lokiarchaeota archaeon]|nr:hypothetical protein [Candidatus Lokiarchaeota archaeon]